MLENLKNSPNKYYLNGIFQVQKIEHTLTNMTWTTVITGGFRALQSTISSKTATTSVNSLGNASGKPAAPGGIMSQDAASAIPFSNTSSPKTFKL